MESLNQSTIPLARPVSDFSDVNLLELGSTSIVSHTIFISFQPPDAPKVDGRWIDSGQTFRDHGGLLYGWSHDNTDGCRRRHWHTDVLLDTLVIPDRDQRHGEHFHWKIALKSGRYKVRLGFSDPHPVYSYIDSNIGKLNGCPFSAGKGKGNKEIKMKVDGPEVRIDGSYPRLCALCYIIIRRSSTRQIADSSPAQVIRAASGETVTELPLCMNRAIKELELRVLQKLKKVGIDERRHSGSVAYKGSSLSRLQAIQDVGRKCVRKCVCSSLSGLQAIQDVARKPSEDSLLTAAGTITSPKQSIKISFQPADAHARHGYWIDSGQTCRDHGGLVYGWSHDNTDGCRRRNWHTNSLLDTLVIPDRNRKHGADFHWKIVLQPGEYKVKLGFSDPHPIYGRRDSNAGKLNGNCFDVGPNKEVTMRVAGPEVRIEGSYPQLCALCYIVIRSTAAPQNGSSTELQVVNANGEKPSTILSEFLADFAIFVLLALLASRVLSWAL